MASSFREFANDRRGSLSIAFAMTGLVATMLVGASIDYSRSIGMQQKLQSAVDTAMLAAVQASAANRNSVATQALNASLANSGISATWTTSPRLNGDGTMSGAVRGSLPTVFMSIAQVNSMTASASSTVEIPVPQTASNVTFSLTGAYGWWWKQVDLYIHTVGAASDTLLASYVYQPSNLSGAGGRGTGTTTALFLSNGSMVSGNVDTPVAMGSGYDNAYLKMTVYTDGCGPGMAGYTTTSNGSTQQNCVVSGTKVGRTTYNKSASPAVYSTNDTGTAKYLFVNGVELANGATPTIFTLLPCNQTSTQAWEDGGGWAQQDIFFNVTTVCASNSNYKLGARVKN
ncbi:MAG: pilus assembly protein [Rhodoblastus sp.]